MQIPGGHSCRVPLVNNLTIGLHIGMGMHDRVGAQRILNITALPVGSKAIVEVPVHSLAQAIRPGGALLPAQRGQLLVADEVSAERAYACIVVAEGAKQRRHLQFYSICSVGIASWRYSDTQRHLMATMALRSTPQMQEALLMQQYLGFSKVRSFYLHGAALFVASKETMQQTTGELEAGMRCD